MRSRVKAAVILLLALCAKADKTADAQPSQNFKNAANSSKLLEVSIDKEEMINAVKSSAPLVDVGQYSIVSNDPDAKPVRVIMMKKDDVKKPKKIEGTTSGESKIFNIKPNDPRAAGGWVKVDVVQHVSNESKSDEKKPVSKESASDEETNNNNKKKLVKNNNDATTRGRLKFNPADFGDEPSSYEKNDNYPDPVQFRKRVEEVNTMRFASHRIPEIPAPPSSQEDIIPPLVKRLLMQLVANKRPDNASSSVASTTLETDGVKKQTLQYNVTVNDSNRSTINPINADSATSKRKQIVIKRPLSQKIDANEDLITDDTAYEGTTRKNFRKFQRPKSLTLNNDQSSDDAKIINKFVDMFMEKPPRESEAPEDSPKQSTPISTTTTPPPPPPPTTTTIRNNNLYTRTSRTTERPNYPSTYQIPEVTPEVRTPKRTSNVFRGSQKFVPNKYETLSSFIPDSYMRDIYKDSEYTYNGPRRNVNRNRGHQKYDEDDKENESTQTDEDDTSRRPANKNRGSVRVSNGISDGSGPSDEFQRTNNRNPASDVINRGTAKRPNQRVNHQGSGNGGEVQNNQRGSNRRPDDGVHNADSQSNDQGIRTNVGANNGNRGGLRKRPNYAQNSTRNGGSNKNPFSETNGGEIDSNKNNRESSQGNNAGGDANANKNESITLGTRYDGDASNVTLNSNFNANNGNKGPAFQYQTTQSSVSGFNNGNRNKGTAFQYQTTPQSSVSGFNNGNRSKGTAFQYQTTQSSVNGFNNGNNSNSSPSGNINDNANVNSTAQEYRPKTQNNPFNNQNSNNGNIPDRNVNYNQYKTVGLSTQRPNLKNGNYEDYSDRSGLKNPNRNSQQTYRQNYRPNIQEYPQNNQYDNKPTTDKQRPNSNNGQNENGNPADKYSPVGGDDVGDKNNPPVQPKYTKIIGLRRPKGEAAGESDDKSQNNPGGELNLQPPKFGENYDDNVRQTNEYEDVNNGVVTSERPQPSGFTSNSFNRFGSGFASSTTKSPFGNYGKDTKTQSTLGKRFTSSFNQNNYYSTQRPAVTSDYDGSTSSDRGDRLKEKTTNSSSSFGKGFSNPLNQNQYYSTQRPGVTSDYDQYYKSTSQSNSQSSSGNGLKDKSTDASTTFGKGFSNSLNQNQYYSTQSPGATSDYDQYYKSTSLSNLPNNQGNGFIRKSTVDPSTFGKGFSNSANENQYYSTQGVTSDYDQYYRSTSESSSQSSQGNGLKDKSIAVPLTLGKGFSNSLNQNNQYTTQRPGVTSNYDQYYRSTSQSNSQRNGLKDKSTDSSTTFGKGFSNSFNQNQYYSTQRPGATSDYDQYYRSTSDLNASSDQGNDITEQSTDYNNNNNYYSSSPKSIDAKQNNGQYSPSSPDYNNDVFSTIRPNPTVTNYGQNERFSTKNPHFNTGGGSQSSTGSDFSNAANPVNGLNIELLPPTSGDTADKTNNEVLNTSENIHSYTDKAKNTNKAPSGGGFSITHTDVDEPRGNTFEVSPDGRFNIKSQIYNKEQERDAKKYEPNDYKAIDYSQRGNVRYGQDKPFNYDVSYEVVDGEYPAGYRYKFDTSNGISAFQKGTLMKVNKNSIFFVTGSYEYISPDGTPVKVVYTADQNGYHPQIIKQDSPYHKTQQLESQVDENATEAPGNDDVNIDSTTASQIL